MTFSDDEQVKRYERKLGYSIPFEFIDNPSGIKGAVEHLRMHKVLGVDTETTGLDPFTHKVLLLQISSPEKSFVVDTRKVDASEFKCVLEDPEIIKVMHFAKFDYQMLFVHFGIQMKNIFCTLLVEQLLVCGLQKSGFSLEAIAWKYLSTPMDKRTRKEFEGMEDIDFSVEQILYAANDAYVLLELYNQQSVLLKNSDLERISLLEFNCCPVLAEMEISGCLLDVEKWRGMLDIAQQNQKDARIRALEGFRPVIPQHTLFKSVDMNLNSPKQLLDGLHKLGIDVEDTNEKTLQKVKHPVVDDIKDYRSWDKIIKTYGETLLAKINNKTGRIHPKIKQLGADTGRTSGNDPNQQNLPSYNPKDPRSLNLRSCFIAKPGYKYVGADFSQQELRILAEMSGEPTFVKAFQRGEDIHSRTAATIFRVDLDDVEKEQRRKAKTANFALIYGSGPGGLAALLEILFEEAKKLLNDYFVNLPKIRQFMGRCYADTLKNGFSQTISGRRRNYVFPSKDDPNYDRIMKHIKRMSGNHPIQGSGADVAKQALVNVKEYVEEAGIDAFPVLFVHDEIILECKEEDVEVASKVLQKAMLDGFSTFFKRVPMIVDVWTADHWIKG